MRHPASARNRYARLQMKIAYTTPGWKKRPPSSPLAAGVTVGTHRTLPSRLFYSGHYAGTPTPPISHHPAREPEPKRKTPRTCACARSVVQNRFVLGFL